AGRLRETGTAGMTRRAVALAALFAVMAAACDREETTPAPEVPHTRNVQVFFLRGDGCHVVPVSREVSGTRPFDFAWGALELLLDGPTEEESAHGFRSAFPDSIRVWQDWQSHVAFDIDPEHGHDKVRILDIREEEHRILYVDFSSEIEAFRGGAEGVCGIVRQVEATVRQFPEFHDVRISVEGRTRGILQP
ncbi:GerMN domain-containing protein, partial [bacterium]|nr:GerMN domain-containing protein [bacterium]